MIAGMKRLQLLARVEAVEQRHADVDDDHVGPQLAGRLEQGASVRDGADDVELGLQQVLERLRDQHVIVGEQDSRPLHAELALAQRAPAPTTLTVVAARRGGVDPHRPAARSAAVRAC